MKKINLVTLILSLLLINNLNADVSGFGYGQSESEAKKEALADLAGNIKSEVHSKFESHSNDTSATHKIEINVSANLPILGAEFSTRDASLYVESSVVLSSNKAKKLYLAKLKNISAEIDTVLKEIKQTKSSSSKLNLYQDIYSLLNEYSRYESVAIILDARELIQPSINRAQVKIQIAKLTSNIDTITMASTVLSKSFTKKNIFVYAPQLKNYTTVSEFGAVLQSHLKGSVQAVHSLNDAEYILVGSYSLSKKNMVLNYDLLEVMTNNLVSSKTITINQSAYKDLKTTPKNIDFDALLQAGIVKSSDLQVSLKSNRGSENLLFREKEEVELFIKLNKMGYIYIQGYT